MAAKKAGKEQILAHFFDDGVYTPLFQEGAVSAAYGCACESPGFLYSAHCLLQHFSSSAVYKQ